jgi:hypothetical protein
MSKVLIVGSFLTAVLYGISPSEVQVAEVPPTTTTTTVAPTTTVVQTTTTTTTTVVATTTTVPPPSIPPGLHHPEWASLALKVGWPASQLHNLDKVVHRESRGIADVWNRDDPMSGSRGLMQVNGYWCKRTQFNRHDAGFLGIAGVVESCNDLFDPETNLAAALTIYEYGIDNHGCGWGPWRTKGFNPCKR